LQEDAKSQNQPQTWNSPAGSREKPTFRGGYLFRTEVVGGTCAAFVGFLEIFAQKAGKSNL